MLTLAFLHSERMLIVDWNAGMLRTYFSLIIAALLALPLSAQVLDKQKLLDRETFWDNRDWEWYKANIPFFECPDADIQTTYYYRWELLTKHLTYGSPTTGLRFHRIHRPPVLVRNLRRDQLPGGASALRGALTARPALRARLLALLVTNARSSATAL
jgi:hypothetical protein